MDEQKTSSFLLYLHNKEGSSIQYELTNPINVWMSEDSFSDPQITTFPSMEEPVQTPKNIQIYKSTQIIECSLK